MEILLPFECICGKSVQYAVEEKKIKMKVLFSTVCSSCQTTAFIKINAFFPDTGEIEYTVAAKANE